ncbi:MAG: hypothetical protein KJO78_14055 [Alphaproteobacteria bacterium]|nr:hypothetical protein [Alphaproteobacteria bacterium]
MVFRRTLPAGLLVAAIALGACSVTPEASRDLSTDMLPASAMVPPKARPSIMRPMPRPQRDIAVVRPAPRPDNIAMIAGLGVADTAPVN